jgi:hypothetical protein
MVTKVAEVEASQAVYKKLRAAVDFEQDVEITPEEAQVLLRFINATVYKRSAYLYPEEM